MQRGFVYIEILWGVVGVSALLLRGLFCLFPYVSELSSYALDQWHGVALAGSLLFLGYAEGYKGFQLKFSPRAAARLAVIWRDPTCARVLLAPLFCMGFFDATPKRKRIAYGLTLMVIALILLVEQLPQPWRGIVDAGVLLGLGWGLCSFWMASIRVFSGAMVPVDPELS